MMFFRQAIWLCLILIIVNPENSQACSIPPPSLYEHHTALVMSAQTIVLAKAIAAKDKDPYGFATFVFKPVETLKGKPPENIERQGMLEGSIAANDYGFEGIDFDGHKSPYFWAWGSGNGAVQPNCGLSSVFEVGETYLLFIRDKPHTRAQEKILEDDDLWLAVVRLVAENYGEGTLESFLDAPESDNMSQCIESVISNDEFLYVRHLMIDACIDRHAGD